MLKSFKYRMYPNKTQEQVLNDTLTTCRNLYNSALEERINKYQQEQKSVKCFDQINALTGNKNEYQKQVYSQVLQETLRRLDKSFKRFFEGKKKCTKVGFPRFKNKHRYRSFCYPQSGFKLIDKKIKLSKIGNVPIKLSRNIEGKVKTCIVVRDVDQWFIIITAEQQEVEKQRLLGSIGVDVGIESLATLSNGEHFANPRHWKKSSNKLARRQRRLNKRKKGSKNRNKQRLKVARTHRKIRNQRDDYLHKVSTNLVKRFGIIIFENLNIKGMLRNHKLAKHISDASWNKLIQLTTYKAESAGGEVRLVNPRYTSQKCSNCDCLVKKDLSVRVHECPACGLKIHRDHNAGINIHTAGSAGIYAFGSASKTLDAMSVKDKCQVRAG